MANTKKGFKTSEEAAKAGSLGGKASWVGRRPHPDDARSHAISLKLSSNELSLIDRKCKELGISRPELIIRAVKAYKHKEKK
ncbi:MAG: ribbon-helix-helix domain-containing protein [Eubacteriaceae bacterium]|nr:ribbon-helix-helix domain-containing protein [Eubacteriaceae bacterium]